MPGVSGAQKFSVGVQKRKAVLVTLELTDPLVNNHLHVYIVHAAVIIGFDAARGTLAHGAQRTHTLHYKFNVGVASCTDLESRN